MSLWDVAPLLLELPLPVLLEPLSPLLPLLLLELPLSPLLLCDWVLAAVVVGAACFVVVFLVVVVSGGGEGASVDEVEVVVGAGLGFVDVVVGLTDVVECVVVAGAVLLVTSGASETFLEAELDLVRARRDAEDEEEGVTVETEAETMTFAGATVGDESDEVEEATLVVDAEARPVL